MSVNNPQANAPVERVHPVILNMLLTKYLDNKVIYYIYPWGETLASISWAIRASYHRNIWSTPDQSIFVRDMIFNLASVFDWQVITTRKHQKFDIDNVRKIAKQFRHNYKVDYLV